MGWLTINDLLNLIPCIEMTRGFASSHLSIPSGFAVSDASTVDLDRFATRGFVNIQKLIPCSSTVEQDPVKIEVRGSNPCGGANFVFYWQGVSGQRAF